MKNTIVPQLNIHRLTQEQYDRELAAGNIDDNAIYLTPDEEIPNPDWNQNDETAADYIKNSIVPHMNQCHSTTCYTASQ